MIISVKDFDITGFTGEELLSLRDKIESYGLHCATPYTVESKVMSYDFYDALMQCQRILREVLLNGYFDS